MAEENNDIIEDTSDGIENWIYYKHERKQEESADTNTYADTGQELVYADYSLVDGVEQKFQYEGCDGNVVVSSNNVDDENSVQVDEQVQTNDSTGDTSEHNLILRETIDENGQLVEEYFCQQCKLSYEYIDDFLGAHPWLEIVNKNTEVEKAQQTSDLKTAESENKLWDLVENLNEVENVIDGEEEEADIKPNYLQYDDSSQGKEISSSGIDTEKEHYFCYDCQQVFTDLITAENHDCTNELQTADDLIEIDSKMLADDDNTYRCHLCDKDYPTLRSFTNHQRWHKKSEALLGHTKTLHEKPAVCDICNTIFACEKNLKLHMKMHKKQTVKTIQDALPAGAQEEYNDLNQFFCEICNKSFDQNLLGIHKNMHQNCEEYSCGKCNKNFENLPSYEIHMQMHMDNLRKEQLTKKPSLAEQVPTTSAQGLAAGGKRKHACQYCDKEFLRPYEKVKHERIHTGEKPYECEVCGKTFRVSYSLTLHLRTHTDIRPYVCATCNKRFKQQSVYVHHLKTHEAECAYKCDVCGKSFRTSVQLGGHKNIHSKPYNCTECNRPFASLYAVKIHMKTHNKCHKSNKNLKNRCSICGASYARVFALSLHIKEQHGIDVDPLKLSAANTNIQKNMLAETTLLMNTSNLSGNQAMKFIEEDDEENVESNEVNNEDDDDVYSSHLDDKETIRKTLHNNVYVDETEAATQTILNTEEISVDHLPVEEIITDWLVK